MDGTILVADDDRSIRTVLTQALTRAGCRVRSTGSVSTLWRWIEEGEGDAVVSDVMMPDGNGLDVLPAIKRRRPDLPVIVISAQNTVLTAIKASEVGAFDYLPKPFDLKDLLTKVNKALSQGMSARKATESEDAATQALPLIGSSPAMQEVYRLLARVLNTDLNVLISGESGTGKSLLAGALHSLGHRAKNGFETIPMATTQPAQLARIIFEELPEGSTVYFDEVAEMSPDAQLKLLEILQSPGFKSKNLRVISSTRTALVNLVNEGLFREDLFFRLNVMPISLPPLRERMDDIPELARHFLGFAAEQGLPVKTLPSKGLELMRTALWAGNVRELENFIQRLIVLTPEDDISVDLIEQSLAAMPKLRPENDPLSGEKLSTAVEAQIKRYFDLHGDALPPPGLYNRILREVELPLLALTLSATRGNQIKAAELLGINRNTLRKKIASLDIKVTRTKKMM